jgi:subfamily B ATP-binding cassette protein MsbA
LIVWALGVISSWAGSRIGKRYFVGLQLDGWEAALDASPATERRVEEIDTGAVVTTARSAATAPVSGFYAKAVQDGATAVAATTVGTFGIVQNVVTFVTALLSVRSLGWRVVVAFVVVVSAALFLTQLQARRLRERRRFHEQTRSNLNARTADILEHRDLIRAWEQTDATKERLSHVADEYATCDAALDVANRRYRDGTVAIFDVGRIAVVAMFAVYVGQSTSSTFDVFFASTLYFRLLGPMNALVNTVQDWADTRGSTAIFSALLSPEPPPQVGPQGTATAPQSSDDPLLVRFRNITYCYPGRDVPAFQGLSFDIPRDQISLLVGRSGSGKTTIARLVMGFIRPSQSQGEILFDGQRVESMTRDDLLKRIDYVSQAHHALHGTIAENLFPEDGASDSTLRERLERVGLGECSLTDEATELSYGQQQRLAIARLFSASGADLAILDEPVTGLDAFTMADIYAVLRDELLRRPRTVLIISHRLIYTRMVDHVITLLGDRDAHEVIRVEQGSREEMMRDGTVFRRLYDQARAELDGEPLRPL